ncbi:proton-conducting transporter membrane subunit [Pelagibacterium montanilacus]|uniref:proton-conducting transporter transmembrane domain-containing protein n=1 Tax=Pelagibacterium montanilacus TaxID=2185280 RepID=UPI000F8DE4C1|nr:proton-conducting transporter membrane subunit [Pelagibacterium montanilacus]
METEGSSYDALDLPVAMIEAGSVAAGEWIVVWPVALALLGAGLLVMLRGHKALQAWFAAAIVLAITVSNLTLLVTVFENGPVALTMGGWLPPFGITFAADMTSALFALAASIATLVVLVYAQVEIEDREYGYGFFPLLLLLLCGVSGSFLTGDIFNLYVWFEVMLIASFGLLSMGGTRIQLDGTLKYGFLNLLATTFFLIAIAYTYGLTGTLNMADLVAKADDLPLGPMLTVAALFLFAFAIKAAAFPANAWLPAAYHTPKVAVSAVFGGLLTKVGAYAAIRILVMIFPEGRDMLVPAITALAVTTMVLGPLGAMAQTNLRRAVGFMVIGGIGVILGGLAIVAPADVQGMAATAVARQGLGGAVLYGFHSMLTLTAFYLVAGLIERMSGTDDIRFMGGLYLASVPLSIMFVVLVFAIAGMPPFLGFWPKLILVEGTIRAGNWVLMVALLVNSLLTLVAASRLWAHIFWRNGEEGARSEQRNTRLRVLEPREVRFGLMPVIALMALIVVFGLFPNWLFEAGGVAGLDLVMPDRYVDAVFAEVPN